MPGNLKRSNYTFKLCAGFLFGGTAVALLMPLFVERKRPNALTNKVIVITGGSRGLGLALSQAALEAGGKVAMLARDEVELQHGREMLLKLGFQSASIRVFTCDVTNQPQVRNVMFSIENELGPIDVLINNAGIISVGPMENQDLDAFKASMQTNFFGALHCTLAVLPQMLQRRVGQIVNIASIGGLIPVPHLLPYSASKFALVGFSRGLAAELKFKGIHVLTVCPWLMRTGSHLQAFFTGRRSKEYRWFSTGATLPVISVAALGSARRVIAAIEDKEEQLLISPWSALSSLIAHCAPATTIWALAIVSRFVLPASRECASAPSTGFNVRQDEWKPVRKISSRLTAEWNQKP